MTDFERSHRRWANRFCLLLLLAHIPALACVAGWFHTGILLSVVVSSLVLAGPTALFLANPESQTTSLSLASASMVISVPCLSISATA